MTTPHRPLHLSDYEYPLPPELIAQAPATPRDHSRLLISHPHGLTDARFHDLPGLLAPGDLLVLNDTRVIPARMFGHKVGSGGRCEILLLRPLDATTRNWEGLVRSAKPARVGQRIAITPASHWEVTARIAERCHLELHGPLTPAELLEEHGQMPLPPYIASAGSALDRSRYQTVFAERPGAVAAPTAGLHFTPQLLERLRAHGVRVSHVTLHVGLGTFQPVRCADPTQHRIHPEWCELPAATVEAIHHTKGAGGRVVAVGTTTVRTLESAVDAEGRLAPFTGESSLFIHPGEFRFRVVDRLITNFHLPGSTLLLLVAAFAGEARWRRDYQHAVATGYRFYSYGDAMFIVP